MSTMATGGFSTRSASVEGFHHAGIEWLIIVFMLIAGINFNLHFLVLVEKKIKLYFKDQELILYVVGVTLASLIIAYSIIHAGYFKGVEDSLRIASFQVLAIITTTGYASANFELWVEGAPLAIGILVLLMFVGGCAGSTGGGVKIIRHQR